MSNFDPNADRSGRSQAERKQAQLLSDMAKSLDTQHHNTSLMHEFGSAFEAPAAVVPNTSGVGTVGQAPSPARSDHQHGVEVPTFIYPTLINGWTNYGGYQATRYYKMGGRVWIEGLITAGTIGATIFNLQVGYRPLATQLFVTDSNNAAGRIDVGADGNVVPTRGVNTYFGLWCSFIPGI